VGLQGPEKVQALLVPSNARVKGTGANSAPYRARTRTESQQCVSKVPTLPVCFASSAHSVHRVLSCPHLESLLCSSTHKGSSCRPAEAPRFILQSRIPQNDLHSDKHRVLPSRLYTSLPLHPWLGCVCPELAVGPVRLGSSPSWAPQAAGSTWKVTTAALRALASAAYARVLAKPWPQPLVLWALNPHPAPARRPWVTLNLNLLIHEMEK
jgi:hypothetical protein